MKILAPLALLVSILVVGVDFLYDHSIDTCIWLVNVAVWGYITYQVWSES